jgi:hypothetical protein
MAIYAHATPVDPTVYGAQPPLRTTVDAAMPPGTRGLSWDMYCGGGGGTCDFGSGTVSVVDVYGTRLYLNEGVDPTLEVTGGSLTGTGVKSGQMSVAFAAADTDSGVASASVSLGGTEVGSLQIACANNDWSACPRSVSGQTIAVDTTKVPDGNRDLVVTLRDAANNAVSRSLGAVTVSNAAGSAATAGVANGVGASRTAKIAARFTTTKKRARTLRFTASPTIKGSLVDETGKPIAGALVAVLARSRQAGADDVQIASATTGAEGGFSLKLPSGASRTITFAYTAFSGDAKPATKATLKTTVRARISARIAPRSVRAGAAIVLTGRLALLPRRGVEVKIQARQGSRWRTIDDVRTTRTGSFRWPYRFSTRQARRTYAFRARVVSPIYPFAAASSKAVLVRVR